MKFLIVLTFIAFATGVHAQSGNTRVWRCDRNTYTDNEQVARAQNCKLVDGGHVTVIQGTRVNNPTTPAASPANGGVRVATAPPAAPRVESNEQRAREADARAILEAELKKAEARRAELLKEWNNGEPEKLGPETRNYQKYLDRVAELKASIARNESDIAGIKRELSRVGGTVPASK